MDIGAVAQAFIGAQVGQLQLAVAAKMLKMQAAQAQDIAKMIDAAQANIDRLANVAAHIGTNLDISA
jgi:hypothetical protein